MAGITAAQIKDQARIEALYRQHDELFRTLDLVLFKGASEKIESEEAERATIAAAKSGSQDALIRLTLAYGPALRTLVLRRYGCRHKGEFFRTDAPEDDVLRAACMDAMLVAIGEFDPAKHRRLAVNLTKKGKARAAVDATANETLRNALGIVVPAETIHVFWWVLGKAEAKIKAEQGREYLSRRERIEVAAALADADPKIPLTGERVRDVALALDSAAATSLNAPLDADPVDDNDKLDWEDIIAAPEAVPYGTTAEIKAKAAQALLALDPKELEIVQLAYGFEPFAYRALSDGEICEEEAIKEKYGYSRSTVCRIRNKALAKMRAALGVDEDA